MPGGEPGGVLEISGTGYANMNKIGTHRHGSVFPGAFVGPVWPESAPPILYWGCSKGGLIAQNVYNWRLRFSILKAFPGGVPRGV